MTETWKRMVVIFPMMIQTKLDWEMIFPLTILIMLPFQQQEDQEEKFKKIVGRIATTMRVRTIKDGLLKFYIIEIRIVSN